VRSAPLSAYTVQEGESSDSSLADDRDDNDTGGSASAGGVRSCWSAGRSEAVMPPASAALPPSNLPGLGPCVEVGEERAEPVDATSGKLSVQPPSSGPTLGSFSAAQAPETSGTHKSSSVLPEAAGAGAPGQRSSFASTQAALQAAKDSLHAPVGIVKQLSQRTSQEAASLARKAEAACASMLRRANASDQQQP
jgi:hypothetical protein